MMIKGCILALAFSSAYAAENKPRAGGSPNPNQAARNGGVRNYSGPYKAGVSNSGYGRSKVVANNSRWGNRRRRPGRIRRRKPRPANWVRPSRPANWQGPTEPDSYDSGDSYDDTASWADDDYDKCDAKLRSTCCDLPDSLSVQDKKDICYAVGCNYDKCDWSDDGYDTAEPTSEPTWSADGWQKDGWNDDGHYVCLAVDQAMCCNLPQSISDYKKMSLCNKVGCDYDKCDWSDDGWKHDTHKPTLKPTVSPTLSPTLSPTDDYKACDVQSRDICCNQSDRLSVDDRKRVCNRLGCMYNKCGWKRDGYDDDDSKPAWKNDGYNNDYDDGYNNDYDVKYDNDDDDKYDVDYNNVKDLYDLQWDTRDKNNYNGGDDDKYDHVNDYDDDKCSSEERRVCCTANEKKQWQVCKILGCNLRKCDKRDWDDDGFEEKDVNKVRYNNNNNNNKIPTARPTWRNSPYYMDGINNRPTPRPTYRTYATEQYSTGQYNPYAPPTAWQGDSYAPPTAWQ
eukprot:scaffold7657_cov115-Skeletonema_dohrnii-CCMP3373.AAC.11